MTAEARQVATRMGWDPETVLHDWTWDHLRKLRDLAWIAGPLKVVDPEQADSVHATMVRKLADNAGQAR